MDKRDWYFQQVVTEGEMDEAFDRVEDSINITMTDPDLVGIMVGGDLAPANPENLTVILSTPMIGYDDQGQRIFVASENPIDISVDSNSVSTAVAGGGNEKIVSVFIEFDVVLSDPEQDGNSQQVFTSITESYLITVVQGAESAPPATPPALQSGKLLLGDITRTFGQTQIFLADIDLSRQQTTFKLTTANFTIDAGTIEEALQAQLQIIEDHIANLASAHPADAITFDPAATEHVSTDVQGAIEECGVLEGTNDWTGANGTGVFNRFLESAIEFYSQDSNGLSWGPSVSRIRTFQFEGTVPANPHQVAHTITSNSGTPNPYLLTGHPTNGIFNFIVEGVIVAATGNSVASITAWLSFRYHFIVTRSAGAWTLQGTGGSPDTNGFSGGSAPVVTLVVNGNELDFRITFSATEEGDPYRVFTKITSLEVLMSA